MILNKNVLTIQTLVINSHIFKIIVKTSIYSCLNADSLLEIIQKNIEICKEPEKFVKTQSFLLSYLRIQLRRIWKAVIERFPGNAIEKDLFLLLNKIKKVVHNKTKRASKTNLVWTFNKIIYRIAEILHGARPQKELLSHRNIKKLIVLVWLAHFRVV